ncbi:phage tail protein [Bacillus wiedmannii]|uniref:phage tail protein n=1 Tax=Bacillus wiedmannii TaxID=1890302 RepID=UPI001CC0C6C7|nr:phage tail protein [Bacillus wiedmannii]MBZ4222504.1 phage tail protein [Bacillus wiedmannii]
MLMVTDLTGNSEPLVGFKGFTRKRLINGERTLSFSLFPYKENQVAFPITKEESVIEFEDEEYVIKLLKERNMGRKFYKQAEAIHKFYVDLKGKQKYEKYSGSMTFQSALDFVFEGTGYKTAVIDAFYAKSWENFGGENRLALLQKALKRYKAEMTVKGNLVTFRTQIGEDTDFQFRYNFNIKTFERIVDTTNLATYIRGYGKDGLMREYTSPNIKIFGKIDAPFVDDDRFTTVSGLDERLRNDLQDTPLISITIDFVDLRKAGYPYIVPNEGDRVFLIYEPMNIDVETRIVAIEEEYDENLELIRTKVTLSNIKQDFSDAITSAIDKSLSEIIDDNGKVKYNVLDDGVKRASAAIKSAETALKFENGILAIDPKNPNNLVAFNSAGIGISRDGGYSFKNALTYEGLVAEVGVVGAFSANNIRTGIMASHENTFKIDLDRSAIDFYSVTNKISTTISQARASDGREISYWTIESTANKDAAISLGKRNPDGSVTQTIYVDGEFGDLYSFAPSAYWHATMNFKGTTIFEQPIEFRGTAARFDTDIRGKSWSLTNFTGMNGGARFAPNESGKGALGDSKNVWGEVYANGLNGVTLNGLKIEDIVSDSRYGRSRADAAFSFASDNRSRIDSVGIKLNGVESTANTANYQAQNNMRAIIALENWSKGAEAAIKELQAKVNK